MNKDPEPPDRTSVDLLVPTPAGSATELVEITSETVEPAIETVDIATEMEDEGEIPDIAIPIPVETITITKACCTRMGCVIGENDNMLGCKKCERSTHFICSLLPAYQIALFQQKKYKNYICEDCVGEIPEAVKINCVGEATKGFLDRTKEFDEATKELVDKSKDVETLLNKSKDLQSKLMDRDEELWTLRNKQSKTTTTQTTCSWSTYEEVVEQKDALENELVTVRDELNRVSDERKELKTKFTLAQTHSSWSARETLKKEKSLLEVQFKQLNEKTTKLEEKNKVQNEKLCAAETEMERINDCLVEEKNKNAVICENLNAEKRANIILSKKIEGYVSEQDQIEIKLKSQAAVISTMKRNNEAEKNKTVHFSAEVTNNELKKMQSKIDTAQLVVAEKNNQIVNLKAKADEYENTVSNLQATVQVREADLIEQQKKFEEAGNPDFNNLTSIENSMKKHLETIAESLKNTLKGEILQTLSQNAGPPAAPVSGTTEANAEEPPKSWSNIAAQPQAFKTMMHEARNEEKLEDSEKKKRCCNIIIHGADEMGDSPEIIKKEDEGYVKEIFVKLGIKSVPTSIVRLGEQNESKRRPIKIVMKTKEEKDKIMRSLGNLKGTERYFGKISVKDDYTTNEREQIRLLTVKAGKLNEENPEKTFKVRGNSKNGWRLVSFARNQ